MVSCLHLNQLIGSTDGSIRMSYGLIHRDSGITSSFHTRQIIFPILFTVYHTLETHTLDLVRLVNPTPSSTSNGRYIPLPNGLASHPTTPRWGSFDPAVQDLLRHRLAEENDDKHCLLGLDVRNVYGVPFEVTLIRAEGSSECSRSGSLGPLIPCRRRIFR